MATIGLYGIMAFAASSRTREIGVRMALGADRRNLLLLILRQGAWQLGIGLAVGLGLAALLSRALGILLFNVRPWDPTIFAAVVAALAMAGLVACLIPASRATRTDPVDALRYD
jgi:ABC-type antimicrobial peptide transport system permease subunit